MSLDAHEWDVFRKTLGKLAFGQLYSYKIRGFYIHRYRDHEREQDVHITLTEQMIALRFRSNTAGRE